LRFAARADNNGAFGRGATMARSAHRAKDFLCTIRGKNLLSLFVLSLALLVSANRAEAAGGAFAVDDSEIGKPGDCKVESFGAFAGNHDFIGVVSPACVFQFWRPAEVGLAFERSRSGGEWATGVVLKGKTNIISVEERGFGVALSGGISYDITGHTTDAVFAAIPLSYKAAEQLLFNFNIGWSWDRTIDRHFLTWGVGFEYEFKGPFVLIGEIFGQDSENPAGQLGLRYKLHEKADLDLIYGRNLTGEQANWVTVGLNLRF
jgi:hypothetical protein